MKNGLLMIVMWGLVNACGAPDSTPNSHRFNLEGSLWVEIGSNDTFLKKTKTEDTANLANRGPRVCSLYKGQKYFLYSAPELVGDHYKINVVNFINRGCAFSRGYVYVKHLKGTSLGTSMIQKTLNFPLSHRPYEDYTTGIRKFGSDRSGGGRLHAGSDLYSAVGNEVLALSDGKILDFYYFYSGTYALVVEHWYGNDKRVVRYGEISHMAPSIVIGSQVRKGQKI